MNARKTLVVDSSVVAKWLNEKDEKFIEQADKILKDVQNKKATIIAPELVKYEEGNALLYKQSKFSHALGSLATLYHIPIQFISQNDKQAQETMKIAYKNKMTYYDASFIALAKKEKADLITDNPKHQQKYKKRDVKVISLKSYKSIR